VNSKVVRMAFVLRPATAREPRDGTAFDRYYQELGAP
jgi:hypothetical protein